MKNHKAILVASILFLGALLGGSILLPRGPDDVEALLLEGSGTSSSSDGGGFVSFIGPVDADDNTCKKDAGFNKEIAEAHLLLAGVAQRIAISEHAVAAAAEDRASNYMNNEYVICRQEYHTRVVRQLFGIGPAREDAAIDLQDDGDSMLTFGLRKMHDGDNFIDDIKDVDVVDNPDKVNELYCAANREYVRAIDAFVRSYNFYVAAADVFGSAEDAFAVAIIYMDIDCENTPGGFLPPGE